MKRPPSSRRHLDTRALLDYLEHRLDAAGRQRVEDHLAGPCERCRELLHGVGRLVDSMRADPAAAVPDAIRARALEVFAGRTAAPEVAGRAWQLASLVFDSLRDPLPALVRRTVGEARWLRFALGGYALEMEVEPEAGAAWTLRGRLAIPEPALYRIEVGAAGERLHAWPDAEGRFAIERVPAGEIEIAVSGPEERFRLPRLAL